MSSRRPSTASTDAGTPRMPFASAEALLWGPEMKQQHAYLLKEMRALERQHEAYDARIQQTEVAAEAAEAATARVRHLEQKLAAIQAVDDDKAFEKWASGEMTRLGVFVDTNKHVRQKQIELCDEVSHIAEDVDQLKNGPTNLKALLRRVDLLESGRDEDARRIKSLEGEVTRLKTGRPGSSRSIISPRSNLSRNNGLRRTITPSEPAHAEISDAEGTTEDEIIMTPRRPTQEKIQVPRSPETREKNSDVILPLSTKGQPIMSARQRLMRRPSIHDTMLPQFMEEARQQETSKPRGYRRNPIPPPTQIVKQTRHHLAPSPDSEHEPAQRRTPYLPNSSPVSQGRQYRAPAPERDLEPRKSSARKAPPATQIVNRSSPRKRKQPGDEQPPPTQRVTRLQAKKSQESFAEQRDASEARSIDFQSAQITEPPSSRKKIKMTPTQQRPGRSKAASGQATQVTTSSPRKKNPATTAGPSENTFIEPAQLASPKKTNKTSVPSSPRKKAIPSPSKKVISSPRKKAVAPPNKKATASPSKKPVNKPVKEQLIMILPNQRTDTELDRGEGDHTSLSTADRVKMSPRKAAATSPYKVLPRPSNARANRPTGAAIAGSSRSSGRAGGPENDTRSSSRTLSPEKRTRNNNAARSPSAVSSTTTRNRRVIREGSNYGEFKRLQAQGDLP